MFDQFREAGARQIKQERQVHVDESGEFGTVGRSQMLDELLVEGRVDGRAGGPLSHLDRR